MRTVSTLADNRELSQAVRELITGGTNAASSLTLDAGATSTLVKDELAAPGSWVLLTPTSAPAAGSGWWVSAKANGSFTVSHSSAPAGCTFDYLILH